MCRRYKSFLRLEKVLHALSCQQPLLLSTLSIVSDGSYGALIIYCSKSSLLDGGITCFSEIYLRSNIPSIIRIHNMRVEVIITRMIVQA